MPKRKKIPLIHFFFGQIELPGGLGGWFWNFHIELWSTVSHEEKGPPNLLVTRSKLINESKPINIKWLPFFNPAH